MATDETRDGVELTNLDQPLFDDADATKRDLIDYLDAVSDHLLPELRDRPLSVIRARPGQAPFMQKNLPRYAPDWIATETQWAEASQRDVAYALCNDRRTLLWFANQRAVEYHPALAGSQLVLDLDPPPDADFSAVVSAAHLVRRVADDAGLPGAVKTSGAKGLHVCFPVAPGTEPDAAAAATRALAERAAALEPNLVTTAFLKEDRGGRVFVDFTRARGATLAAAYSPRIRPGVPVSYPVPWDDLDRVSPADFTIATVPGLLAVRPNDPWLDSVPPTPLPDDLVEEGRTYPSARVQAMHEGKRRKRRRAQS